MVTTPSADITSSVKPPLTRNPNPTSSTLVVPIMVGTPPGFCFTSLEHSVNHQPWPISDENQHFDDGNHVRLSEGGSDRVHGALPALS